VRVLVGGIGYRNLRDHSFGVLVVDRLAERAWPPGIAVEDISYGPIAVVQRLQDDPPDRRFERAVIVSAVERIGRPAGALTVYRWDRALPGQREIQTAVTEAVTGVIAMDNTLIVAKHFNALPDEVLVLELQPEAHEFGDELSAPAAEAFGRACDLVATAATETSLAARFAVMPLGGGAPRLVRSVDPQVSDVWTRTR